MNLSLAEMTAQLTKKEREEILNQIAPTQVDKLALQYYWPFWARPKQILPDGTWTKFLILAGRGFGKTRAVTEWARYKAESMPGSRGAIVSATAADARDIVVEGESGILAVCPPWNKPIYEPSKRRITWPNGSIATLYTADKPDRLRGPQHHWAIADELAAWRYGENAWDMLMFGLRLGDNPQCAIATTPRPIKLLKQLMSDSGTVIVRGSTYENRSNLSSSFLSQIIAKYENTRLGRQELFAEILDDVAGALWSHSLLEKHRVDRAPSLYRIIVSIDPASSANDKSNDTGIIVAGISEDGHGYVLEDATLKGSPAEWGEIAVLLYDQYKADKIIAEVNNGGDMVEHVVTSAAKDLYERKERTSKYVAYQSIRATKGKYTRAEPIAALYEQGRIHHVGMFPQLEDELASWVPGQDSPDRLDSLVWNFTESMLGGAYEQFESPYG